MADLIFNRWFQLGAAVTVSALVFTMIGVVIAGSGSVDSLKDPTSTMATGDLSDQTGIGGSVTLMSGTSPIKPGEFERGMPLSADSAIELPLTTAEAVAAGWKDPVLCSIGRGRFFQKGPAGEGEPYFLMYNSFDDLIGVYLYSETEMPLPWERHDLLSGGGGLTIIDYPHWSLVVYFRDSVRACKAKEGAGVLSMYSPGEGGAVRSTPTQVVPPTPTPSASQALEGVVAQTARVKSLSFTLTDDPEAREVEGTLGSKGTLTLVREGVVTVSNSAGTTQVLDANSLPFSFDSLGATLSAIAGALQEPVDTKAAFIDNLKRRGISGTVLGSDLSALVPTAMADARVAVSLWFDEKDRIVRLRIEGAVTPDDPPDAVRVLDLGGFRR